MISNSWGGLEPSEPLEDGITDALEYGRNGKGCVVVFSAGNDDRPIINYPASEIPDIIVVGAMSPCGERKKSSSCDGESFWGSNYGPELDIVAPGVKIPTTDLSGVAGYSSGDYFNSFNGTSSACPHVAGVAALLLSLRPELFQKEVALAISRSATKLPRYAFSVDREYGTWNQEVGYGLVNALETLKYISEESDITYFEDKDVTSDETVMGNIIYSKNVIIRSNAVLQFVFGQYVEINQPFTVEKGSGFLMTFR